MSVDSAAEAFADEAVVAFEDAPSVEALGGTDDPDDAEPAFGTEFVTDADGGPDNDKAAGAGMAISTCVLAAIIRAVADGARETRVPERVIGDPPAAKVWLPTM